MAEFCLAGNHSGLKTEPFAAATSWMEHQAEQHGAAFMRVLLGMIFGALMTTGVVFVADHWNNASPTTTGSGSGTTVYRPMVNWDVVEENLRILSDHARQGWTTLSHKING